MLSPIITILAPVCFYIKISIADFFLRFFPKEGKKSSCTNFPTLITMIENHQKKSHLSYYIFSTNFCPIKSDLQCVRARLSLLMYCKQYYGSDILARTPCTVNTCECSYYVVFVDNIEIRRIINCATITSFFIHLKQRNHEEPSLPHHQI